MIQGLLAVNTLAPYLLTALVKRPNRLVYLSSKLHLNGEPSLDDLTWEKRPWDGTQAYSDSKLHDVLLAFAVARRWPGIRSNALEPGWVPTKMGGPSATDDIDLAPRTQVWLAEGIAPQTQVTGSYFYHQRQATALKAASDIALQEKFLSICAQLSGVRMPEV